MNEQFKNILKFIRNKMTVLQTMEPKTRIQKIEREEMLFDDKLDTKDLFFGLYDENCIGIFQKMNFKEKKNSPLQQEVAYIGLDTDHIGLWKQTNQKHWLRNGESMRTHQGTFCATCTMKAVVSFSHIYFCFQANKQENFEEESTSRQILTLLPYVYDYFDIERPEDEKKQKVFYKRIEKKKRYFPL